MFIYARSEQCDLIGGPTFNHLREQSLRKLQTGAEGILFGYETIF